MFLPLIAAWIVSMPVCCMPPQVAASADDCGARGRTIVLNLSGDCGQTAQMRVIADADSEDEPGEATAHAYTYATQNDEMQPKVWIGVRVTPVPAPLAAHIGAHGVMVSNVVKDSPADKAGLEQYDVLVAVEGKELNRPQDLTAVVAKAAADKAVKLTLIRKGARQELTITPATRPGDTDWELKYPEPEDSAVDDAVKMYGRALQLGPKGHWIMRDLGPLHGVPDALDQLHQQLEELNIDIDKLPDAGDVDHDLDVRILRKLGEAETQPADDDAGAQVEIKIKIEKDGKTTSIERDTDGKFEVTHEDAQGQESSATYDTRAEFEEGDPAAFKLYSEHATGQRARVIEVHPRWDKLGNLRHEFQINVEQKVKEAMERAKEETEEARELQHQALKDLHERLGKARVEIRKSHDEAGAETLIVRVNDDGSIKVVVAKDGEKQIYEFKNKEEFKAAQPELYERVGKLLE